MRSIPIQCQRLNRDRMECGSWFFQLLVDPLTRWHVSQSEHTSQWLQSCCSSSTCVRGTGQEEGGTVKAAQLVITLVMYDFHPTINSFNFF